MPEVEEVLGVPKVSKVPEVPEVPKVPEVLKVPKVPVCQCAEDVKGGRPSTTEQWLCRKQINDH